MPMREPDGSVKSGGRLSGKDVRQYLEGFAEQFLKGKIRFETEVLNLSRGDHGRGWNVLVHDKRMNTEKNCHYSRIILCTGVSFDPALIRDHIYSYQGCSTPRYPESLTPVAAKAARFLGPVVHSMNFRSRIDDFLTCTNSVDPRVAPGASIIVIGGGRSAQE
jgi:dimethylaniline monooxygenase (N-oxide forming)